MSIHFNIAEERVLHGLIEEAAGGILVRLDSAGFIIHASANAVQLGLDLSALLLMPHITDYAHPDYSGDMVRYVNSVLCGGDAPDWFEFPISRQMPDAEILTCLPAANIPNDGSPDCGRWFALSLRRIEDDDDAPQGALGLLRSVQEKHSLEVELNARGLTDPLTGLANRHAFCADLHRSIASGGENSMAVLAVDGLRAIFMQYGQRTADEIQWGFAKFLETMTAEGHPLAQLDSERFAVLLNGVSLRQARSWADDALKTFAGLAATSSGRAPDLSASAGVAGVERNVDWTLRQAELGLVLARAGGGMRVGSSNNVAGSAPTAKANAQKIERAMDAARARAERRKP